MKLKSILYLLIALPLLWSCNNEDNIEDIFSSGTWYLINFYGGGLDDAGTPEFTPKDDNATLEVIQKFTIVFNNDNTFKASAQNITFEGIWEANGKDRSVSINIEDRRNSTNQAHQANCQTDDKQPNTHRGQNTTAKDPTYQLYYEKASLQYIIHLSITAPYK